MERTIHTDGQEVTVFTGEHQIGSPVVITGINGESHNPNRHAVSMKPEEARRVAKLLNAAADLA